MNTTGNNGETLGNYRLCTIRLIQPRASERGLLGRCAWVCISWLRRKLQSRPCRRTKLWSNRTSNASLARSASSRTSATQTSSNSMKYIVFESDHWDHDSHPPYHGIRRGRRTIRLYCEVQACRVEWGSEVHAPNSGWSRVHPQDWNRASGSQTIKSPARQQS